MHSQIHRPRKYEHPLSFWAGVTAVTVGILFQLPMLYAARHSHYRLAGMAVSPGMYIGMAMIAGGTVLATYGVFPVRSPTPQGSSRVRVRALDSAPIRRSHVALLFVLTLAIVIDVMKPTTLAFVAPGAAAEYGLSGPLNPGGPPSSSPV